jgi:hypothetical protein
MARKSQTRKSMKHQLPMHMNTMAHLNHWHCKMFEKLGWMTLAKAKGYDFKVSAYKKSVEHLHKSILHVMKEYQDPDRIHDLNVLRLEVECLMETIHKCL